MLAQTRRSGVAALGEVPWGTHVCQLFQSSEDLRDVLVGYFQQGLQSREFCLWVTADPLGVEEARAALRPAVPDLDERIRLGQIEFLDCRQWYLCEGQFDAGRVLEGWKEKEQAALARGYEGLRVSVNASWLDKSTWKSFLDYEAVVNDVIRPRRMLVLCSYALDKHRGGEMLDILRNHPLVLIRRESDWEVVRSPHQRKMMELLRQSEQRQSAILDTIPDPTWLTDKEGHYLAVNGAWRRFLGQETKDVGGTTAFEYFPPAIAARFAEQDRRIIQSRQPLQSEDLLSDQEGRPIWFETVKSPLLDDRGEVVGISGIARDITGRRRAEQEKLELERRFFHAQKLESLGVLAGGIAHDFNNILAGIMGYADLAKSRLPSTEPAREDLDVIEKAVLRAAELTRQMLAYSGKGKFIVEPVNLSRIVQDMRALLEISLSKKAVLKYELASDLPPIRADASQLHQIILTLVVNASEAIGEAGGVIAVATDTIRLSAAECAAIHGGSDLREGLYVRLQVADTGCGMAQETLQTIFDPFFTTKFAGRGLGLAAAQGIVRAHQGAIRVFSRFGEGTTFQVLLPASGAAAPCSPGDALPAPPWRGSGTVLVVDDEEIVRTVARRMIEQTGFSVLTANDGQEAVGLYREREKDISCVLLDLTMPKMNGEETFHALRRIRPDVRVILSSGYAEESAIERLAGARPAGFIQKPYQLDALTAVLRRVMHAAAQ